MMLLFLRKVVTYLIISTIIIVIFIASSTSKEGLVHQPNNSTTSSNIIANHHHTSRDLLIGFGANYDIHTLYRLVHAFHLFCFDSQQYIAIFVTTLSDKQKSLLSKRFPRVHLLDPNEVVKPGDNYRGINPSKIANPAFSRYIYIAKYIFDHKNDYDKVIVTDIRDTAIYGDPFPQINISDVEIGGVVQSYTEFWRYRNDPVSNPTWIWNCYGKGFLQSLQDEWITCCGTFAGTTDAIVDYHHAFIEEFKKHQGCDKGGIDTAIHVWIIHKVLKNARTIDSNHSLIRHSPYKLSVTEQFDVGSGGLLNSDGKLYSLIHQYDRHRTLVEHYHKRHDILMLEPDFDDWLNWPTT